MRQPSRTVGKSPSQRMRSAALALALTAPLVAWGTPAPAAPKPKPAPLAPRGPLSAPDLPSALATARLRKAKVEVLDRATGQSRTWANPDGTLTTDAYAAPQRVKQSGQWVDVDTTLTAAADGSVAPKAHDRGLKLAGGGKDTTLAAVGSGDRQVAVGWHGTLPKPSLHGDTATYAEVSPGADLTVQATRTGFEQFVVLGRRPAAGYQVTLPVTAKGLKAAQTPDGSVTFTDAAGKAAGVIPTPVMWDAALDAKSLEHPHRAPVKMTMSQAGDTVNLTLTPDAAFLADPATKYPVTVDPSASLSSVLDTFAQTSYSTPQYSSTDLKLGTYNGGADTARSFLQFPVQQLANTKILSSSLNLYEYWSGNCVQNSWELWQTGAASTSTVWTNQPSWTTKYATTSQTKGYPASCGGAIAPGWVSVDPSAFLQYAGDHGYSYANLGLRATNETDSNSWKRFYSANNGSNVPYLSVTYNAYPMAATPNVAPGVSSVSGSTTTLWSDSATPELQATVTDADGGNLMTQWNVYDTTGGGNTQVIANLNGSWTASGGISSAQVPAGKLTDGHTYTAWPWGFDGSLWSRQTVPGGLTFKVDTTLPNAPTVSSADYPAGGWAKGAGQTGSFTLTPPASGGDTGGLVWQLDNGAQTTTPTTGAAVTVTATPAADGPHRLTVLTRDLAGNLSAPTTYDFDAGTGAVTSPAKGDRTDKRVTLTAAGGATAQSVTFQYRRAGADTWTDIPVADVALSAWPVAITGGVSAPLVWNVAASLGDDGALQVRGRFTDSATGSYTSSGVDLTLDRHSSQAASTDIGPGSLNLSTGDYLLSSKDAAFFDLTLSRSASSRNPSGGAARGQVAPFGPQWSLSGVSNAAGTAYTEIRPVTANAVQLVVAGGDEIPFTKGSDGTWTPGPGNEDFSLGYNAAANTYALTDLSGTVTVFTAAAGGVWAISSSTPGGTGNDTRYRFDSVTSGSDTLLRLARMAAPTTAVTDLAGSCLTAATPAFGCRLLELGYATATTATGTTSGFGDYTGQVSTLTLWAPDPATGTEKATVVAHYAYGSDGLLRQVSDPRISPALVTAYGYDAAGRVTSLTPPGQLAWSFAYGTAGTDGDPNAGRLLNVSRAALAPGTASTVSGSSTTTVVYDVPLGTSASGPYALDAASAATWAQTDLPTDATAVFPADQTPAANTGSGHLASGDYARATVHYLDQSGRETNAAHPGGHLTTTEWDRYGNTVRTLTAGNRELALGSGTDPRLIELGLGAMTTAQRAVQLSTQNVYTDATHPTDTYGPLHRVTLEHDLAASGSAAAMPAGTRVAARAHTHNTFDEGRPTDGSAKVSSEVTTTVTGAAVQGYATDADLRTSTTAYDWNTGQPTSATTDPGSLAITTSTAYNAAGAMISRSQPSSNGSDAGTTTTTYYTATGSAPCGGHPEWADLVCRTAPAGAITGGGGNPTDRVTATTTYDLFGAPVTLTETANGTTRTTTTGYDAAGRPTTVAIGGGPGQAVQTGTNSYDPVTGLPASSATPDGASIHQSYDQLGRRLAYTDADGNTAGLQYDNLDRPTKLTDSAPSTLTYSYDTAKDPRGLLTSETDSNAGTFTAGYDADGNPVSQGLPGSVSLSTATDPAGRTTSRVYTDGSGSVLLSDQVSYSADGRMLTRARSGSGGLGVDDTYQYDADGRLTGVTEPVTNGSTAVCSTRAYAFDKDSSRVSQTTATGAVATPGTAPVCPTSGGTTVAHSLDSADRLADTGYGYDAFGRVTAEPNGTTNEYWNNDLVRRQTTGTNRTTWSLDPAGRFHSYQLETNTGGTWTQTASRVNHYDTDGDSPSWVVENTTTGALTRYVPAIGGGLAASWSSAGTVTLQLTDVHGDVGMTLPVNDVNAPVVVLASDEFGNPLAGTQNARFGWLGSQERSAETPTGDVLMGVRLYSPSLGRFLSVDPVLGGNANAYIYPADPLTGNDLDGRRIDPGGPINNYHTPKYWPHSGRGMLEQCKHGARSSWACAMTWAAASEADLACRVYFWRSSDTVRARSGMGDAFLHAVWAAAADAYGGWSSFHLVLDHENDGWGPYWDGYMDTTNDWRGYYAWENSPWWAGLGWVEHQLYQKARNGQLYTLQSGI
ncbi:DNRLRE domain-containing protein [Kitasatospora sp. McL0602]|uniref:DNRLRE domain-containing protein n=1 Tax=Kitasatospora sp. McL0602 TaxID=3439530 RepID=UPI003F8B3F71